MTDRPNNKLGDPLDRLNMEPPSALRDDLTTIDLERYWAAWKNSLPIPTFGRVWLTQPLVSMILSGEIREEEMLNKHHIQPIIFRDVRRRAEEAWRLLDLAATLSA